jgi:hypothetical protein
MLSSEDVGFNADVPLMEAGMDSLAATELASQLGSLAGAELSSTLIFEHPTARAIASHMTAIAGEEQDGDGMPMDAPLEVAPPHGEAMEVGVCSAESRWPGEATSAAHVHALLRAAGDAIVAVPTQRWLVADAPQLTRYGGFIAGLQRFDNGRFGISAAEANHMDPQQRLVLEVGYAALHGSGQQRSALAGSNVGLFIAIEHVDWQLMQALRTSRTALQRASAYGASGEQPHVASGRLAFALDLRGPIASINTAWRKPDGS